MNAGMALAQMAPEEGMKEEQTKLL